MIFQSVVQAYSHYTCNSSKPYIKLEFYYIYQNIILKKSTQSSAGHLLRVLAFLKSTTLRNSTICMITVLKKKSSRSNVQISTLKST